MASYYNKSSISLLLFLIISGLISLAQSINNGGVTVDLIHCDSPLSPYHDPSKTHFERLRGAVNHSFSRKSSLLLRSSNSVGLDQTLEAPITGAGGGYLIEYQIGTPPVRQLSVIDTGSDLTWIQCKPCTNCYKQDYPYFDPSATTTYRPVACKTDQCAYLALETWCGNSNVCQYNYGYGDNSFSQGNLATDTLTLGSTPFYKFVFGCGYNNAGTFEAEESGIFGLGNGAISFVNQQRGSVNGRFSYCLTSLNSKVPSKISFGSNAVVAGPNVLSTPLVSKMTDTFYYLKIKGLSVGTERFNYKYNSEEAKEEEGNIIIDSGTTLTFIPSELYQGIESSLVSVIKGTRANDPQGMFSLCYELPMSPPPLITAHFEGANLELPEENIFMKVSEGIVCLTLLPSQDLAIFGNLHQAGYLIGYDIPKKQVNFLKTDCTKYHR